MKIRVFLVLISSLFVVVSCTNRKTISMQEVYNSQLTAHYNALYPDMSWVPKGTPLRLPEEIIAVWIPSYVRSDGTMVSSHYVFIVVRPSRWYFEEGPSGVLNEIKTEEDKKLEDEQDTYTP